MEAINTTTNAGTEFSAPTCAADFPQGETKIEHTYPNGNKVVFCLLGNGAVACIREGSGHDVEKAELECGADKEKYMSSLMASCIKIDGRAYNMHELKELKMKDFLTLKAEFATLNF